jgi:hypothetical protein
VQRLGDGHRQLEAGFFGGLGHIHQDAVGEGLGAGIRVDDWTKDWVPPWGIYPMYLMVYCLWSTICEGKMSISPMFSMHSILVAVVNFASSIIVQYEFGYQRYLLKSSLSRSDQYQVPL